MYSKTQVRYEIKTVFPEWCDAEGTYITWADREVDASDEAIRLRRKYPPCSVTVSEVKLVSHDGITSAVPGAVIGFLSASRTWWR